MKHSNTVTVINNPLGTPSSSDGVMMLVCKAVAVESTFVLDTAYLLTKADDLATLGIDADYDSTNEVAVYQQVSEFYTESGDGAKLWLVGVAKATSYETYLASTTFKNLVRGTNQTDPLNRVKMIGVCYEIPTTIQVANDFPSDVKLAFAVMKTTQSALFAEGYPFSYIFDGYNMSASISMSGLTTLATLGNYSGSICVTGSKANGVSAVGSALGRFSRISVGHGFGAVKDGAISLTSGYLTNGNLTKLDNTATLVVGVTYLVSEDTVTYNSNTYAIGDTFVCVTNHTSFTGSGKVNAQAKEVRKLFSSDIDALGEKQFMFFCTIADHSGYYWNDGATAELATKPLSTQEYNRLANKLVSSAYAFMIETKGSNVPIDTKTGLVAKGYTNTLQEDFIETYINPLKVNGGTGDLTDGSISIVGTPNGNQVTWTYAITIVPTPLVGGSTGTIQFTYTV